MMVRFTMVAALALLSCAPSWAQVQGSSVSMTCRQAAGFVRARGSAVLGTGGQTYDRFVSDRRFCQPTEQTRAALVPTRDNRACFVGYTCFEPSSRLLDDL